MNTSEKVGFNLSNYSVEDEYLRIDLQSNNINKFSTILHSSANLISKAENKTFRKKKFNPSLIYKTK